jgi:hypothetical protein
VILGALAALLLLAAVGLVYYWLDWREARREWRNRDSAEYLKAYGAFLADVRAGRLDEAYQATTSAFRKRVSRTAFEERVNRYLDFERRPDARGVQAGGGGSGPNQETYTYTMEDGEGKRLQKSVTVKHEDSFFYRRPPPPRVSEFSVEEVPSRAPGGP